MDFWRKEFDVINSARYDVLECLDSKELPAAHIARATGIKTPLIYYHLKILIKAALVEKRTFGKTTVDKRAKKAEKPIILFSLTHFGMDALKYFPKTRTARRYL